MIAASRHPLATQTPTPTSPRERAPIIRTPEFVLPSHAFDLRHPRHFFMTLQSSPDESRRPDRWSAVGIALRDWLAALLHRLTRSHAASGPAGSTVLENGRNEGPPDLDELWRDFNRKLSGLFGGKGGGRARQWRRRPGRRRAELPAQHEERRRRRGADRRRDRADLARQRRVHRPGRPAGGGHLVRPLQPHRRCRLPVAAACIRSRRTRPSTSPSCARPRSAATRCRRRPG